MIRGPIESNLSRKKEWQCFASALTNAFQGNLPGQPAVNEPASTEARVGNGTLLCRSARETRCAGIIDRVINMSEPSEVRKFDFFKPAAGMT